MTSNHPATANATIAVLSHVDSQGRGVVRTGRCLMRIFTQRFQRVHLYVSGGFTAVFTALALSIGPGGTFENLCHTSCSFSTAVDHSNR